MRVNLYKKAPDKDGEHLREGRCGQSRGEKLQRDAREER